MSVLVMPRLGETVTEGKVIKWLKNVGDSVERDEMIVEISTDKVDTEIPSPAAGTIEKILVPAGETCAVETELVVIREAGESAAASDDVPAGDPLEASVHDSEPPARAPGEEASTGVISPIVRRLAREHRIDLSEITGTGRGGRVTKQDIEAHFKHAKSAGPGTAAPALPIVPIVPTAIAPAREAGEREEAVPLSNIRKIIARRMMQSIQTAAHVTAVIEVDMEKIVRLRQEHKEEVKRREGFSLTYLPFLCRVVVEALGYWPTLNAELAGDDLILKKYINLGIAVSIPDGLIVPVIKDAEDFTVLGLARAITDLAARARSGHLLLDEIRGGSFTITAPGSFGTVMQTPIINPPEVAILSFDAIVKKPTVVDDEIVIRHMANLSLSYDHRVNDGAVAAQFLADVKAKLEEADFGSEILD